MCNVCNRVKDIMKIEINVIKKHLGKHKWYCGIGDDNAAVADFVWKYAWLMREVYCGKLCPKHANCEAGMPFRSAFLHDISDGELNEHIKASRKGQHHELSWLQLQVVKHHISMHKWYHSIVSYKEAVNNFLDQFGWVIDEMYDAAKAARMQASTISTRPA